jgi:PAS domain S-box-containing protein
MHPLRTIIAVSLVVALAVSVAFAFLLNRASGAGAVPQTSGLETAVIAAAIFLAFSVPAIAVYAWAVRRAADLQTLSDRSAAVAEGNYDQVIADRDFHGELDELGRAAEELRKLIVRQRGSFEEQRAVLREIVAGLGEGLMAINGRGRIVFANTKAAELFGQREDLAGRSFLELVQRRPLVAAIDAALGGKAAAERTSIVVAGQERQIELRVFPVARSTEIAAVALLIDVTTIERFQRIRKDFLEDFSHEVRTPLAGIRSAAETFDHGALTDEQEMQLRHIILRQLDRLERLVGDFSELNRIESGDLVLERRDVDLLELTRDLLADLADRADAAGAAIALEGDRSVAHVDPNRVQQVMSNLIDNAIKYGGGQVKIRLREADGQTIVRVSDRGEGIPPADIERIFHRFYRVDRSRSQHVPGLGLGLAIAKHLVLLHGGSINAENLPEGGAAFEVRLPKV